MLFKLSFVCTKGENVHKQLNKFSFNRLNDNMLINSGFWHTSPQQVNILMFTFIYF